MGLGTRIDPEVGPLDIKSLTTDLKPWQVEREALLLEDNSYMVGFACTPLPTDGMSSDELRQLARRTQAWLQSLPEGEDLRIVYTLEPEQGGALHDYAARAASLEGTLAEIRDARLRSLRGQADRGELVEPRLTILLSYHPPRLRPPNRWALSTVISGLIGIVASAYLEWKSAVGLAAIIFAGLLFLLPRVPSRMAPRLRRQLEEDHRVLRGLREVMMAHLRALGLNPRPLRSEEYLELAWGYMNPRKSASRVDPPPLPGPLYELTRTDAEAAPWALPVSMRQLIAGSDLDRDFTFLRKDDRYIRVLAMDALPVGTTVMCHVLEMLTLREPLTMIADVHKPKSAPLISRLAARTSLLGNVRESAASEAATIGAAVTHESLRRVLWDVFAGKTQLVNLGLAVVLSRESPEALERTSLRLHQKAGNAHAMTLVDETLALSPQFRRLMPGSGLLNRRMRMAMSMNAVHMLPLSGPWRGSPGAEAVFANRWGGLTRLDLFDPRAPAWNGVVAGATGTGKSAFVIQLLLQVLRPKVTAIIIDKGANIPASSYLTLTRALGGTEIVFSLGAGTSINPFDVEPGQLRFFLGEEVPTDIADHATAKHNFLINLVDTLVSQRGGAHLSLDEKNLMGEAIIHTYRRIAAVHGNEQPVFLHDLVPTLRNPGPVGGQEPSPEQKAAMDRIATRLIQWIERGRYAQLLDRPTTVKIGGPITYVDLGPITGQPDLMPVAILMLNDLIYRQALRRVGKERTIVVQDELWAVLRDPIAAQFLDDMYRRFRHVGASVLSVSQDMRDFSSPEARAILGNSTWWFLLQPTDPRATIEMAQLNDGEAALLASLGSRAGEYSEILVLARLGDHRESGVIQAVPTSLEFWLSASAAHEKALRAEYVADAGDLQRGLRRLAHDHPHGVDAFSEKGMLA